MKIEFLPYIPEEVDSRVINDPIGLKFHDLSMQMLEFNSDYQLSDEEMYLGTQSAMVIWNNYNRMYQ